MPLEDDRAGPLRIGSIAHREHCELPSAVLDRRGIEIGQQVRLRSGDRAALFTVVGTADAVVTGRAGADRLGGADWRGSLNRRTIEEGDPVAVDTRVETFPHERVHGTFREELTVGGDHVVAVAPHGGEMEPWTDVQAEVLADRLGGAAWVCRGRTPGVGAFFQWHITSNDLDPRSFPRLCQIADRGFGAAVSFHAWRREGVGVGGGAPRSLRVAVRDAIAEAIDDGVDVELVEEGTYAGDDPGNLVNWLTAGESGGIQLEQGLSARRDHGEAVVDAVASVLDRRTG